MPGRSQLAWHDGWPPWPVMHERPFPRVELTEKKSKLFYGEKNVLTIYCYKAKIVDLFVFQHFVFHAVSSILGVKVPVTCISPKFSYLVSRI